MLPRVDEDDDCDNLDRFSFPPSFGNETLRFNSELTVRFPPDANKLQVADLSAVSRDSGMVPVIEKSRSRMPLSGGLDCSEAMWSTVTQSTVFKTDKKIQQV